MSKIIMASVLLAVWNLTVFIMYGMDKHRAKCKSRRISEKTLLLSAAIMGGFGAMLGMYMLRHKTKHIRFQIGVPVLLVLNIAAVAAAIYFIGFLSA